MNFAIIGTNVVTVEFLKAGAECKDFTLTAVYSRTMERAEEYKNKYGAKYAFDSLDDLCACKEVEAVYVASPTSCHHDQVIKILSSGKHVLCEKPIASNAREVSSMIDCAKKNNVILLEAMRPEFSPNLEKLKDLLPKLGDIRHVVITFCKYSSKYDSFLAKVPVNAFNPELSNGALMDLGCYCFNVLLQLFGKPTRIQSSAAKLSNGVDAVGACVCEYDGLIAEISYSKVCDTYNKCEIQGEKGTLSFKDPATLADISLVMRKQPPEKIDAPVAEHDMIYELEEFIKCAENGADFMTHQQFSIDTMQLMDEIRKQCDIVFPADNRKI
jgi:predicted dehydrogenase